MLLILYFAGSRVEKPIPDSRPVSIVAERCPSPSLAPLACQMREVPSPSLALTRGGAGLQTLVASCPGTAALGAPAGSLPREEEEEIFIRQQKNRIQKKASGRDQREPGGTVTPPAP